MAICGMLLIVTIVLEYSGMCGGLKYSDLVAINATCSPFDSCQDYSVNTPFPQNWLSRNCFCDELCAEYADCCLDSQHYSERKHKENTDEYECVELMQYGNIYMKGKCTEGWQDEEVSELCLSGSPESNEGKRDPFGNLPVTSLFSSITYINYYCAICNHDAQDLKLWQAGYECDVTLTREEVATNLAFTDGNWGVSRKNNGSVEFYKCSIVPVMPEELENVTRKCSAAIRTCAANWSDAEVVDLCQSYTAVVYDSMSIDSQPYRNRHCVLCNNVSVDYITCSMLHLRFGLNRPTVISFALLFDFSDKSGNNVVGSTSPCRESEVWDPFFRRCRSIVCARPEEVFRYSKCASPDDVLNATVSSEPSTVTPSNLAPSDSTEVTTGRNISIAFPTDRSSIISFPTDPPEALDTPPTISPLSSTLANTAVSSNESSEFLQCDKILLSQGKEEFVLFENGSVYVEAYGRLYLEGEYEVSEGGVLVCSLHTSTAKFSEVMGWVSLVGLGLSCVCLLFHLFAFLLVPDLRNLSGKNLASLCIALFASFTIFIVNMFIQPSSTTECVVIAMFMYYFFLSSFTWMSTIGFDIWYTFRMSKVELRVTGGKQRHRFLVFSLYSWLLPTVFVSVVTAIDVLQPEGIPEQYLPRLGKNWCWFGHRKALLVYFAVPIAVIIVINSCLFISTAKIIAETRLATSSMTTNAHNKRQFHMYLRLAVLMGFSWIIGIVAGYLQVEGVWYVFVVLNTLQGVFIFLAFTCRTKVWRTVRFRVQNVFQRPHSWIPRHIFTTDQNVELSVPADGHSLSVSGITSTERSSPNTTLERF